MESKRFIKIKALEVDNELIPFWKLEYYKTEYGEGYQLSQGFKTYYSALVDCLWDMKKKEICSAVVKDIYDVKFQIGTVVLVEVSSDSYSEDTIIDITFGEYESEFMSSKKLKKDSYWKKFFTSNELDSGNLFEIRKWRPTYILKSGKVVEWEHELKYKV